MKKTALILMVLTIFSKIMGFSRDIILSYFYGASGVSDAYLISLTIPTVIFTFVGVGLSTTFIPIFSQVLQEDGEEKANDFTNNVINLLMLISSIIVIAVLFFSGPIVKIFASGFEGKTLSLAISLTRITIFSIYITGIIYIFKGYLEIKNNFIAPVLIGIPLNLFLITSIFLSTKTDLIVLGYGKIAAVIAQLFFLTPFLVKKGYQYNFNFGFSNPRLKKMMYLSIPIILGTSVNQINMLVDRTLASQVAIGGISALNYADQLNSFVQGIFVMSIATVMFATISKMAVEKNIVGIKKSLGESITGISLLVLPAMVGSMIFAVPIVSLLFGRGEFDNRAVLMSSEALYYYSIGMIALGVREVLARAFYSLQDTKTPMINAAIGMILNIALNFILVQYLGLGGLALATSIAAIFTTVLMFISLRKKIGPFGMKQISISFLKILFASLIMGGLAKLSFNYLTTSLSQNFSLLIAIGVGAVSYFVIIYFMKIEDVDVIVGAIKKKFGRGVA
ncbi:murein biosynthesis integral membrane protein MurJ [Marinilactibacillus psychrotolerans]|uniref:murein biosynthesis integral membrane protein MurJ n=1 Tax=Marinilactibacillus psychrotolerans TaxID=191770 RepID=UPI0038128C58